MGKMCTILLHKKRQTLTITPGHHVGFMFACTKNETVVIDAV